MESGKPAAFPPLPMGLAVLGLPRSGTTLVSDLLTVPGRAVIVSEPDLYKKWNRNLAGRVQRLARTVGIDVPEEAPDPARWEGHYGRYFRAELAPRFAGLDLWGIKYVDFSDWRPLFRDYPPEKLILCVRDLRDLVLSGIDRICRMQMVFRSSGHRRDEAWVFSALVYNAWELMTLRKRPHLALRYEDLAGDPATLARIANYAGLDQLDPTRHNLAAAGWHRRWEVEKHGDAITAASVDRIDREPTGPVRALAERLWQLLPEYGAAFGYPVSDGAAQLAGHMFRQRGGARNPIVFSDTERWDWNGPPGIEPCFARRRARAMAARSIRRPVRVLDLGGGSRALAGLLPAGSTHVLADNMRRAEDMRVGDIYGGSLPPTDDIDLIVALDVLEYMADLPAFLAALRATGKPALVSYHASDDSADTDRAALGWRNALDRASLANAFAKAGFDMNVRWAFDKAQSLFRLQPR
ncbi:MAG: methyltransferase domain-containing protein [Dongiaceae bacterium]